MTIRQALGLTVAVVMAGAWPLGCGRAQPERLDSVQVVPATGPDILRRVRESGGKAVLVNVWATWCGPCREEFPDLVRLARNYRGRGLTVLLVSADFDTELPAVKQFLARQGVDFPTFIKSGKDMALINAFDPRWTGAIPATFLYDGTGKLRAYWEGARSYAMFEEKVLEIMNPKEIKP
jgi:thiol-disulfide isomerase/thioredoxin